MYYCIDKIENGTALLIADDERELVISTSLLYDGARENDIVTEKGERFVFCESETKERKKRIEKKLKKLYVKTHDERTIQILTFARNTAMQVMLIVGLVSAVIAGYFNITVSITILCCTFVSSLTSLAFVGYYSKKL